MSNKIAPSPSDKPPEEETAPAAEMSAAAALTLETATGTERTEAETAQPPSDDSDAESEDEDDGAPVRFSYANYRKAEIDLYDSVLQSVEKHLQYKLAGVVQFQDLLHTLEGYKRDGYKPEPGTVVEILDASVMEPRHCFQHLRGAGRRCGLRRPPQQRARLRRGRGTSTRSK